MQLGRRASQATTSNVRWLVCCKSRQAGHRVGGRLHPGLGAGKTPGHRASPRPPQARPWATRWTSSPRGAGHRRDGGLFPAAGVYRHSPAAVPRLDLRWRPSSPSGSPLAFEGIRRPHAGSWSSPALGLSAAVWHAPWGGDRRGGSYSPWTWWRRSTGRPAPLRKSL